MLYGQTTTRISLINGQRDRRVFDRRPKSGPPLSAPHSVGPSVTSPLRRTFPPVNETMGCGIARCAFVLNRHSTVVATPAGHAEPTCALRIPGLRRGGYLSRLGSSHMATTIIYYQRDADYMRATSLAEAWFQLGANSRSSSSSPQYGHRLFGTHRLKYKLARERAVYPQ